MEIILFILVGILVGILSGLFGVGGGLIIVPIIVLILSWQEQVTNIMPIAIGTSLATIIFTSISSIIAHQKKRAILWSVWRKMAPGLLIGGVIGAIVVTNLSDKFLSQFFSLFEIIIGIKIWFNIQQPSESTKIISNLLIVSSGVVIGFISTLIGIGGGSMTVPFLLWQKVKMPNAVATATAIGLLIAIFSSISFIIIGLNTNLPQGNTFGFIHMPALLAICGASVIVAPFGVKLAHKLNPQLLQKTFAILLLILGLKMLWY